MWKLKCLCQLDLIVLWSTQGYFYADKILTRSFYLDLQTALFLLRDLPDGWVCFNEKEHILTLVTFSMSQSSSTILVCSGKKSWSAMESGLLNLSLHLPDYVCLLCTKFCATQANLYQATNGDGPWLSDKFLSHDVTRHYMLQCTCMLEMVGMRMLHSRWSKVATTSPIMQVCCNPECTLLVQLYDITETLFNKLR